MKDKWRFRWILDLAGMLILATAVAAPTASRADDSHDKDRPQLDGSIQEVLNRLSDRFHVHIDADWNELQAAGVSPQFSLQSIHAKTLEEGLAAVVSATHFRLTYVTTPGSVRISAAALVDRPATITSPASAETNSPAADSDGAKSDQVLDRVIPDLNLDSVTLEDAISRLAEATHANIVVHWSALNDVSITHLRKIRLHLWNVSLRTALRVIMAEADDSASPIIGFAMDGEGVLNISSVESLPGHVVTRFYNIRDLVQSMVNARPTDPAAPQECVDSIIKMITDVVSPDSWRDAGGSIGAIKEINGVLVVTQTVECQKQIVDLLDGLRQHSLGR